MEVYVNPYMGPCKMTAKWLVNGVVYYDIIEFTRTTIYIYVYTRLCVHVDIVLVFLDPVRMPAMNGNDMSQEFASHDIGFAQKFALTCTCSFHAGH